MIIIFIETGHIKQLHTSLEGVSDEACQFLIIWLLFIPSSSRDFLSCFVVCSRETERGHSLAPCHY